MRVDGKYLELTVGGVEIACVSSSVVLDNDQADADRVTFQDVISGNDREWYFAIEGLPDYAPGSWWTLLWETPQFTPIAYRLRPYGNAVASALQPHFAGYCTVDQKPPLGGDAQAIWTFGTRLTCTARPARLVSA